MYKYQADWNILRSELQHRRSRALALATKLEFSLSMGPSQEVTRTQGKVTSAILKQKNSFQVIISKYHICWRYNDLWYHFPQTAASLLTQQRLCSPSRVRSNGLDL